LSWIDYAGGVVGDVPQPKAETCIMTTLQRGMQRQVTVRFLDDTGHEAPIDGIPQWASSDPAVLRVRPDAGNPLTAIVAAIGPVNATAQWSCTGDADLGSGFEPVLIGDTIQIQAGQAKTGDYTYGEPVPLDDSGS
jgi:hypothetical protein